MTQDNNTPAVIPSAMQNLIMSPPAELMGMLASNFDGAYADFGGVFRSISFKGFQFTLKESGSSTVHPLQYLPIVILGMAHDNHCVWYGKAYGSATEGERPDAVWWEKQGAPANVPASALVKDANGRNQYQIQRRLAVALLRQNHNDGSMFIDLENPFVMDIGAMSIFGADMPNQWAFSLAGLIRFCSRSRVMPLHFVTNVIFDRSQSVPSVRFVPANQNGQLVFLDSFSLEQVYRVAASTEIRDLLNVRVTSTQNPAGNPQSQQPAPAQAPVQQPVQPAPAPAHPAPAQAAPVQAPVQMTATIQPTPAQQPAPAPAAPAAPAPTPAQAQAAPLLQTTQEEVMASITPEVEEIMKKVEVAAEEARRQLAQEQGCGTTMTVQAPAQPSAGSEDVNSALSNLLAAAGSYGEQA